MGENTTDNIIDAAQKYDRVVLVTGSSILDKFSKHIPDLDGIRGELTKITLNEGDNLKNVRNYQKIIKVMIDRRITENSLLIAIGCGEILDLSGFVVSTYKGGIDYLAVPTTLLAQIGNAISGLAGINFSSHEDVICSRSTPTEIIVDSFYTRSTSVDDIRDGVVEMIRYSLMGDHSIISMMQNYDDLKDLKDSDNFLRIIGKSISARTEMASKLRKESSHALGFGTTMGRALGEIYHNRMPYNRCISAGMFLELFLVERSGIQVKETRDRLLSALDRFSIKRASVKEAGIDNILKKLDETFPEENSIIRIPVPVEPGKVTDVEVSKDRLFSLLRSYTELYEFNPLP